MNNFGIYMGGPVIFPKLYNGRNRTFFFGSFEVLRLPKIADLCQQRSHPGHAEWRSVRLPRTRGGGTANC